MSTQITLTAEDLKAMVAAAVASAITESRKPLPPTEKEIAEMKQAQAHREANAAGVIAEIENKRFQQMACTHEHDRRAGGGTHCVWVREEDPRSPGFILCQKCQGRIRPNEYNAEGLPFQRDRGAIFDTNLFNKLFQDCGESTLMG